MTAAERARRYYRRKQGLILSSYRAGNDVVFRDILGLYVPEGSTIADVTYGAGVFWRRIPPGAYDLKATDLAKDGIDCRELPYAAHSLDALVFDPPYQRSHGTVHAYRDEGDRYSREVRQVHARKAHSYFLVFRRPR